MIKFLGKLSDKNIASISLDLKSSDINEDSVELVIPKEIKIAGKGDTLFPVKAIDKEGFADSSITSIVIPKFIKSIKTSAFEECQKLNSIIFEGKINSLGKDAFYNCKSLKKITLPRNIRVLDMGVFTGCTSLEEVNLPETLTAIENCAFKECGNLKEIHIPKSVNYISSSAFYKINFINIKYDGTFKDWQKALDNKQLHILSEKNTSLICYGDWKDFSRTITSTNDLNYILTCIDELKKIYDNTNKETKEYISKEIDSIVSEAVDLNDKLKILTIKQMIDSSIFAYNNNAKQQENVEIE